MRPTSDTIYISCSRSEALVIKYKRKIKMMWLGLTIRPDHDPRGIGIHHRDNQQDKKTDADTL